MSLTKVFGFAGLLVATALMSPAYAAGTVSPANPVTGLTLQASHDLLQPVAHTQKHIDEVKEARERRKAERDRRRKERAQRRKERRLRGGGSF